jgi:hypothetical protein
MKLQPLQTIRNFVTTRLAGKPETSEQPVDRLSRGELQEVLHPGHFQPLQQALGNASRRYLLDAHAGTALQRGLIVSGAAILGAPGLALTVTTQKDGVAAHLIGPNGQRDQLPLKFNPNGDMTVSLPNGDLEFRAGQVARRQGEDELRWHFAGESAEPYQVIAHSGNTTAILDQEGTAKLRKHEDLDIQGNLHRLPEGTAESLDLKSTFESIHVDPWGASKSLHYGGFNKQGNSSGDWVELPIQAGDLGLIRDQAVAGARRIMGSYV